VHSLDASHLMEVIKTSNINKLTVLPIHDCFGTHPNDINILKKILSIEFIKIYSKEEFLKNFHENIKNTIILNNGKIINKDNKEYVSMPN
jgi:DNA-directed RNA polymerase